MVYIIQEVIYPDWYYTLRRDCRLVDWSCHTIAHIAALELNCSRGKEVKRVEQHGAGGCKATDIERENNAKGKRLPVDLKVCGPQLSPL